MSDDATPPSPFGGAPSKPPAGGDQYREGKQAALIGLLGAAFVLGAVDVWLFGPPGPLEGGRLLAAVVGNAALLLIGFRWLYWDALQLDIRRPGWLNVGIILAAIGFVPYYFYKTRPEGRRGMAILGFLGVVIAVSIAMNFGAAVVGLFLGDAATAPPTI